MGPSPSEAFASLEQLACSVDPVELLVGLTQRYLFHPEDEFQAEDSEIQRWARRIELVAGLLLRRPRTVLGSKVPARDDFERVGELAEEYLSSLSREMLREAAAGPHSMGLDIATEARNHSMTVRGDAYPHQFYKFAKSLYGPHEAWFRANLGFTIDEGISISRGFILLYEQRNHASRQRATAEFAIRMGEVPSEDTAAAANSIGESVIEEFHLGRAKENLGLTVEELAETSSVSTEICRHFLERMSQSFGYTHPQHPDAYRDAHRAGWDFSTLSERPFLQDEERYYMLLQSTVGVAIYTTFYFDMIRDNSYKELFNRARGAWLEAETAALLRRVFPTDSVISNPRYPDGTELSDVLVLYDGIILVIQCKSKGLRFESETGLDAVAIREDLQKAVKAAFDQGIRARKFLMGHLPRISIGPNHELELDVSGGGRWDHYGGPAGTTPPMINGG